MTWQLRRAGVSDLDAIMVIENAVFPSDAWSRGTMKAELADRGNYYLVAFPPGHPETVDAYSGLRSLRGNPQADIQTIAVAESARRHGLGRVLMQQMIAEARERGVEELFLEVRADNPGARALYAVLGFEEIAVRPHYYQPDGVDAIVMKLPIPEAQVSLA